ncbi:hypothetical protein Pmani_004821 [Petrolisthes manimaculis]|uniref:Reverse transcriptase/retrotransposon-derived protein RNase H-like domain-containing protein n=1 Tax=Petrolisthes manimaculis TaxID=1843537 RepID=A0AAE1UL76_9EUCA|nr:hypothetical protein Pmani_004821 [Petrolisthes manimaculis]
MLFAYREVPQSSTMFSPFELIYGHSVRGPLSLLREAWEDDEGEEADGEDSSSWKEQMDECVDREQANVAIACEEDDFEDVCIPVIPSFNKKETCKDVKVNENLSVKQKVDVEELTQYFEHLFSDVLGQTNVLQHNIKLKDERPVKKLTKKSSSDKIVWEPKLQDFFDNLKRALCEAPVLKLVNLEKDFVLQTDASMEGNILDRLGQQRRARVMSCGGRCEGGPVYCYYGIYKIVLVYCYYRIYKIVLVYCYYGIYKIVLVYCYSEIS